MSICQKFPKKKNLNAAFRLLRRRGYFAAQNFCCCRTCAWAEVPNGYDKVVFYHRQETASLAESGECYLSWSGDKDEIAGVLSSCGVLKEIPPADNVCFRISIR